MARTDRPFAFSLAILAITLASVRGAPSLTPLALATPAGRALFQMMGVFAGGVDGLLVEVEVDACAVGLS